MQNELKLCPFCGGKYTVNLSDYSWKKYLIVCNVNLGGCGAASGLYDTEEKAIQAWNRRCGDEMD